MKPKILLIEDDKDQVALYKAKFEISGFDFLFAYDEQTGLELASQSKPDLIFLDVILCETNGLDVLRQLKNNPKTKKIPVVLLTNLTKKTLAEEGKNLGAVNYLIKTDITLRELIELAKKTIKA